MNQPISSMCFLPIESSNFLEFEAPPKEILKVQVRGACVFQYWWAWDKKDQIFVGDDEYH